MRYNAKRELYKYVSHLRFGLGITLFDCPVNMLDLCSQEGTTDVRLHPFETNGFCGAAFVGEVSDTIVLNENRSVIERNFDCGHEVIHLTKHRDHNDGFFNCTEKTQDSYLEWEANEGSAELIVPYITFIPDLLDLFNPVTSSGDIFEAFSKLSEKYHVSDMVIKNRSDNLKYEIFQVARGTSISDIEIMSKTQQERQGICVPSCYEVGIAKCFSNLA